MKVGRKRMGGGIGVVWKVVVAFTSFSRSPSTISLSYNMDETETYQTHGGLSLRNIIVQITRCINNIL